MKTSSHLSWTHWNMSAEYLDATAAERTWSVTEPLDFGSIDAPDVSPAGAHHAYRYTSGGFVALPTAIRIR